MLTEADGLGTSPIENLHNYLASSRPRSQGYLSLDTMQMSLGIAILVYNFR